MLTDLNKFEMVFIMMPWVLLAITWMMIYIKHEERKDARKEQTND